MPLGTVVFGAYIGSDQHKFMDLWSPICYMKNIPVGSSCKIILPHYSVSLSIHFHFLNFNGEVLRRYSTRNLYRDIHPLLLFPKNTKLDVSKDHIYIIWSCIMLMTPHDMVVVTGFFSFQLKSYKHLVSIPIKPEAGIHGDLV